MASLDVYVGGAEDAVTAEVLGVSECSDLAVLKLDESELPFLEWREGEVNAGLDVYTMGYPFGEPFTVTRGIVSKAEADGETVWASVRSVIEHDSTINPGNSGGPLVDGDGKLVGINYASDPNNRYYAIGREEAQKVIDRLKVGEDVDSLGMNGQAFVFDESGDGVVEEGEAVELSGIYLYSVETGSPAGEASLKGGDVLLALEDVPLAQDGTMSEYCKILRPTSGSPSRSRPCARRPTRSWKARSTVPPSNRSRPLPRRTTAVVTLPASPPPFRTTRARSRWRCRPSGATWTARRRTSRA